jgi:histidine ammonia-lyase
MYLHSIPNNNDNQDIVSMGTNAALMTAKVIENTFQVAAIQMAAVVHAIEYLGISEQLSSSNKHLYHQLAPMIPLNKEDKPSFIWLRALSNSLKKIDFSA